jgi:chromosome segregation ATPase
MEGIDARAEVKTENVEEQAENRNEAIDERYDAREDNVAAADRPGEDAKQDLLDIEQQRAEYRAQMQTRLDKLAVRLNTAQQKIKVLGPRGPTKLRTNLQTAAKQHELIKQDVEGLSDTPPAEWDETKEQIDDRTEVLDEQVSELSDSIDDV